MRAALPATLLMAAVCSGCTDATSTERGAASDLPSGGEAIHLDAWQRVVLVKAGKKFCAEPSPAAMSAFASALGNGVAASGQGAGSAANAESAASIGLRIQSIALMRDALYRMCEAYENGQLSDAQMAAMMERIQAWIALESQWKDEPNEARTSDPAMRLPPSPGQGRD